jgi:hypothetical protein
MAIDSVSGLREIYRPASGGDVAKVINALDDHPAVVVWPHGLIIAAASAESSDTTSSRSAQRVAQMVAGSSSGPSSGPATI